MIMRKALASIGLSVLAAGCGTSPPVRFFALDPMPSAVGPQMPPAADKPGRWQVQVAAVHIPPTLDRQEIVRQSEAGVLDIDDRNRWGAPLADMTRNVLTEDLVSRLGAPRVVPPEDSVSADCYQVGVDILRLQINSTGRLELEIIWSVSKADADHVAWTRRFVTQRDSSATGYAEEVRLVSETLGQLADQIVQTLTSNLRS